MGHEDIRVGTLAVAYRRSGVCEGGERGVCYEIYERGGRPGYGCIFESGRYDGCSPAEVAAFLTVTETVCSAVQAYQFTNVGRLRQDFLHGRFRAAFAQEVSHG